MTRKTIPFDIEDVKRMEETTPTPFHVYDGAAILARAEALRRAFAWAPGYRNYFAVKATPNPAILELLRAADTGADCSSLAELVMAERSGLTGDRVMFTSNDTPAEEFRKAAKMGATINFDDIGHIGFAERALGGRLPQVACCRYNPGPLKDGNAIIGKPEEAKYGFTRPQLFEGYRMLKERGVRKFGLHAMVASNERSAPYFVETARLLFDLVAALSRELGIAFDFVNLGGGFGIPYRPEEDEIDLDAVGRGVKEAAEDILVRNGIAMPRIATESGRFVTGPCGWLVSRVLHVKRTYRVYAGLDASMANLMRPALYGAYHHITVFGKENAPAAEVYDVTGSLCENNDKFAIARPLPELEPGDVVAIHDAGAHGHAMGFNYNGKLRSAEWLLPPGGGAPVLIRRAETLNDLFSTLVPPLRVRPEPPSGGRG
ncbi:MAG: diaminopimelate decarboxylase [Kiritimatiellae bacterium]|nr:diaminopimelate decarboxylase [Kiritimatiellia bacterium]